MMNGPGAMQQAAAARQAQVGGDWFFWIAGISLLHSVLALFGSGFRSALGLGTTALLDSGLTGLPKAEVLGLDIFAAAFYVLYGFFARNGARWAFLVGALFYALDGLLLLLLFKDWLGVLLHGYALFRIFQGFQAAQQLHTYRSQPSTYGATGYVPPITEPSRDVWPPPPSA